MPFTDKSLKKKRKKNIFIEHLYLKNYKAFQNKDILLSAKGEMFKDKNKVRGINKYSLTLYDCLHILFLIVQETKKDVSQFFYYLIIIFFTTPSPLSTYIP